MCGHGPRISRSRLSIFYFHRTNSPNPWRPDLKENEAVGAAIWQNHLSHFFGFIAIFVFHRVFSNQDGPSRFFPALGFRREVIKGIEHIKGIQRVFWIILVVLVGAKEARPRNEIFDRMVQGCSEEHAINRLCLLLLACCFWKPCFSQSQSRGKDGNKSLSQQSTKCRTYH